MTTLLSRHAAVDAVVRRFKDRPLRAGTNDCVRMASFVLRKLGYGSKLPKSGEYRSMGGGLRRLRALGFDSVEAALDGMGLVRTTLARALPGDIIAVPGEDALPALWVSLPNGRALGWHQDSDCCSIIQPTLTDAIVWSVL